MRKVLITVFIFMFVFVFFGCASPPENTQEPEVVGNGSEGDLLETEYPGLKFVSQEDFVELGFSPAFDANDSFSFELWIKLLDEINHHTILIGPLENQALSYGIHAHARGRISFGLRTTEDVARVDFKDYRINTWYHLAGVYDGDTKSAFFYVDGNLIGTSKLDGIATDLSLKDFVIHKPGTIHGTVSENGPTSCVLFNVRIWDKAITQGEIISNMDNLLTGQEEGLVAYWPLNEGQGFKALDLTPNQNHGEIIGASWHKD